MVTERTKLKSQEAVVEVRHHPEEDSFNTFILINFFLVVTKETPLEYPCLSNSIFSFMKHME